MKIFGRSIVAALFGAMALSGPVSAAIIRVDFTGTIQVESGVDVPTAQPGDLWSASFLYDTETPDTNVADPNFGSYPGLSDFTVSVAGRSYAVPLANSSIVVRNGFGPFLGTGFLDAFGVTGEMDPAFGIEGGRMVIQAQELCVASAPVTCDAFGLISTDLLPSTAAAFQETLLYFINPTTPNRSISFNIVAPPGPIGSTGFTGAVRGNVTGVRAVEVPEPGTLTLMIAALGGLVLVRQARSRAQDDARSRRGAASLI